MGSYTKLLQHQTPTEAPHGETPVSDVSDVSESPSPTTGQPKISAITKSRQPASTPARRSASKPASVLSRKQDSSQASEDMIEQLRQSMKYAGKEAFFGRFTPDEKALLRDIAYTYKRTGTKTSENEIARIGVNFILNDYEANGENSLLHRVLKALSS